VQAFHLPGRETLPVRAWSRITSLDVIAPLDHVVYRHHVPIRFVLTLLLVCNRDFQSLELRKHSRVSLKPVRNVARCSGLSLVNPSLSPSSRLQAGVVDSNFPYFQVRELNIRRLLYLSVGMLHRNIKLSIPAFKKQAIVSSGLAFQRR